MKKQNVLLGPMLMIAVPVALQNVVTVGVSMMDTIMLGSLGEVAMSASSLANQVFFIFTLVVFGTAGGSNILVAQYWGKRDVRAIHKVLGYTYRVVGAAALFLTAVALLFPRQIMCVLSPDPEVIEQGVAYLRIVAYSYLFFGISTVTGHILRSVHEINISLGASVVSLCVNVFFNWMFIFGNLGAPRMGVAGAALATTIARVTECMIMLAYMKWFEKNLRFGLAQMKKLDRGMARPFFKNCTPVICNELLWSVGSSMLMVVMGHMGKEVVAANSIYSVVSQLALVMAQGASSAAAVMVGNTIGSGNMPMLGRQTKMLRKIGVMLGAVAFVMIVGSRPLMPFIYHVSGETLAYMNQIMLIGGFVDFAATLNFVNMVGILRGGGDAKFVLFSDIVFLWLVAVPLGFLTGLVLHWPVWAVFIVLKIDNFIKLAAGILRIRKGKWVKDVTAQEAGS